MLIIANMTTYIAVTDYLEKLSSRNFVIFITDFAVSKHKVEVMAT